MAGELDSGGQDFGQHQSLKQLALIVGMVAAEVLSARLTGFGDQGQIGEAQEFAKSNEPASDTYRLCCRSYLAGTTNAPQIFQTQLSTCHLFFSCQTVCQALVS